MEWEDLENLSFEVSGQAVQLEDGRATFNYGGESSDLYTLQNRVAQGDLDSDGYDDVVAHIVLSSAGSGEFHLIVPVIDDGQGGTAHQPVWVGDRIVIESIDVRDGLVEVSLLDRQLDEPYTVITRRQTLEINFSGPEPEVSVIESLPLGSVTTPAPSPTVSPIDAALPDFNPTPIPGEPSPVIYFTFDDGPHPVYTPQVLDVLARYGARAMFFVIGSLADRYPGTVQRILNEGHTIGNHTWNHESLAGLPREEFDETVGRTQALLGNRSTTCLRPPYASMDAFTRDWAAEHGLSIETWDFSPQDWIQRPAHVMAQDIVDHARDGAILLLHDGGGDRTQTVLALDVALSYLSDQGFRFEPLCT